MSFMIHNLQDNILIFGFAGFLNRNSLSVFEQKLLEYFAGGRLEKPLNLLLILDVNQNDHITEKMVDALKGLTQLQQIEKVAICYSEQSRRWHLGTGALMPLMPLDRSDQLRFFRHERDARMWLTDPLMRQLLSQSPLM